MTELADGKRIYVETWYGNKWTYLKPLEDWEKEYFGEDANYRLPSGSYTDVSFAAKVEITGRTHQLKHHETMVKGKITWYNDDPETVADSSPCWIAVYGDLKPHEMW